MSERNYDVSVVIPTLNDERDIGRALSALESQMYPHELIVVDGHSTDDTVDIAKEFGAEVYLEEIGTRGGACNVGIEKASGDIVVLTDADAYFPPDWLESIVEEFEKTGAHVVGGEDVVEEGTTFERALFAIDVARGVPGEGEEWRRIRGCNSAYLRDVVLKHPFDPELKSIEETELHYRLYEAGYDFSFNPSIEVCHRRRRGLRPLFDQLRRNGRGRAQVVRKHPGLTDFRLDVAPTGLFLLSLAGILATIVYEPFVLVALSVLVLMALVFPIKISVSARRLRAFPILVVVFPLRWVGWSVGYFEELVRGA